MQSFHFSNIIYWKDYHIRTQLLWHLVKNLWLWGSISGFFYSVPLFCVSITPMPNHLS